MKSENNSLKSYKDLRNTQVKVLKLSEMLFGKDDLVYINCLKDVKNTQLKIDNINKNKLIY